jgi:chemotaxis-related protein WspD
MSPHAPHAAPADRCWTAIGVWGDGSCPELSRAGHCRNCTVYAASGRQLLDRPATDEYLDAWTDLLALEKARDATQRVPYVVFRIGQSWLAFRAVLLREITRPGVVRRVPHRSPDLLLGLTAVRGEIHPCLSLHALFGEAAPDLASHTAHFLVAHHRGQDWVFPAEEILGTCDVAEDAIEPLPVTVTHGSARYTSGIVEHKGRPVALVDDALVFSALERRLA